jgi:hypothetical protein
MIVSVTGKKPWLFEDGDFNFYMSAERVDADPKAKPSASKLLSSDPKRIGGGSLKAHFQKTSQSSPARTFVEPGRAAVIDLDADLDAQVSTFVTTHPDGQRCTVADANDNPIGAIAPISDQTDQAEAPPSASR